MSSQIPLPDSIASVGDPFKVKSLVGHKRPLRGNSSSGRRSRAVDTPKGHTIRAALPAQPITRMSEVALGATIRAAAIGSGNQSTNTAISKSRVKSPNHSKTQSFDKLRTSYPIRSHHLRRKVRTARVPNLVLFVVDASGSMAARKRMGAVKGAILSLLVDAYQKRDRVGMVAFRGQKATLVLPPTNSVSLAQRHLEQLPTGGRTPLADGMHLASDLLAQQMKRDNHLEPLLVVVSDGRGNVGNGRYSPQDALETAVLPILKHRWATIVIDCESGYPRLGLAQQLAQQCRGECLKLDELSSNHLVKAVKEFKRK